MNSVLGLVVVEEVLVDAVVGEEVEPDSCDAISLVP